MRRAVANFVAKRKSTIGIIAGACGVYLLSLVCCGTSTWFFAYDAGAKAEKRRIAAGVEKAIAKSQGPLLEVFNEPLGLPAKKQQPAVFNESVPPPPETPAPVANQPKIALALKEAVTVGDIQVVVKEVRIYKPRLKGRYGSGTEFTMKETWLVVSLEIRNLSDVKRYTHFGWSRHSLGISGPRPTLLDEHGNSYLHHGPDSPTVDGLQTSLSKLDPKQVLQDFAMFDTPVDKATELKLTLPAIQDTGPICFRIPVQAIAPEAKKK